MVTKQRLRPRHKLPQQVIPRPFREKFVNIFIVNIMWWSTGGQQDIFPSFYLAYMPVANAGVEMHFIAAKLLIQRSDESLAFAGTDVPATIAPHPPVAYSYQIAAKNDLSFVNRNVHATSLNGAPASIIYLRVIT
jgi:hypothetical protein